MSAEAKPDILDASLLRVPFEALKRAAKDRKAFVDETGEALNAIENASNSSEAEQVEQLDQLVARLHGLKRKLQEVGRQEASEALRCKVRLEHLQLLGQPTKGNVIAWNKQRLSRILVDHLLRRGYHQSAGEQAPWADKAAAQQLLDNGHLLG